MKKSIFIIAFSLILWGCNNSNQPNNSSQGETISKNDPSKISPKEELPIEKICHSDLGIVKMNENAHSLGARTEMTELKKLLAKEDCDICEIVFERKGSYAPMPMKVIYNKREKRLKNIFTKTNVIEDYQNVTEAGLKKFLDKGEKNFAYLESYTDLKYDFNNREMKMNAVGKKPIQSELDGSVVSVMEYIKSKSKDPSSIKFLEWSKVSPFSEFWIVRCKFNGANSFGAMTTENKWFYIQHEKVVKTKDFSE